MVVLFILPNGNRIIFLSNTFFEETDSFFFVTIFEESDWQFEKRSTQEVMKMKRILLFINLKVWFAVKARRR